MVIKNNNRIVLEKFTWDRTTQYLQLTHLNVKAEQQETVKLTNKPKAKSEKLPPRLVGKENIKVWNDLLIESAA